MLNGGNSLNISKYSLWPHNPPSGGYHQVFVISYALQAKEQKKKKKKKKKKDLVAYNHDAIRPIIAGTAMMLSQFVYKTEWVGVFF